MSPISVESFDIVLGRAELRRSKVFQNRRFPRVDILGVRDENSNPLQMSCLPLSFQLRVISNIISKAPVVQSTDLNWRFLANEVIEESTTPDKNRVAYKLQWGPDVGLLGLEHAGKIFQSVADYIRLLGYKKLDLSVFNATGLQEITLSVLEALKSGDSSDVPRFETYTRTNATRSSSSSSATEDALKAWHDSMSLEEFDIEADPSTQGVQLYSYDVMIISILHVSFASLRKVLANARKLLKPDGGLVVLNDGKTSKLGILLNRNPGCKKLSLLV
ncbi:hypothetical protein K504DRAFT_490133 [Pleomassaria siparia CBS 279.74]|uniref:Methyltransferase type 12 domain-containing protein n=1 Tax=Pleomassaria siparia CBS 279.74 TaxID=1314801 RepID=A0A6G1KFA9_9PLEO|nr:hypothetical protein K504DRAFT_490133 [Pleomassaria siparia CBS 279.74]